MRKAKNGRDLPSARRIHTEIFIDADRPSFQHTTALMEWGQVVTHDVASKIERQGTRYEYLLYEGRLLPVFFAVSV